METALVHEIPADAARRTALRVRAVSLIGPVTIAGGVIWGMLQPYRVTAPVALEVGFKLTIDAERAAFVPGLARSDAHNVKGTFRDMIEITKLLQVLTSLELP